MLHESPASHLPVSGEGCVVLYDLMGVVCGMQV